MTKFCLALVCLMFLPLSACGQSGGSGTAPAAPGKNTAAASPAPLKRASEELMKKLSPLQYEVTQLCGTEPAFDNPYWNNHEPGIYVDVVTGVALFSSTDKFDSGTGWPSFTRPISGTSLVEKKDLAYGMVRVEVRSPDDANHLGHVFPDGPGPGGLRYCINSASLRFIPVAELEKEGYGKWKSLFAGKP